MYVDNFFCFVHTTISVNLQKHNIFFTKFNKVSFFTFGGIVAKEEAIEVDGIVKESLPNTMFIVELTNGLIIMDIING